MIEKFLRFIMFSFLGGIFVYGSSCFATPAMDLESVLQGQVASLIEGEITNTNNITDIDGAVYIKDLNDKPQVSGLSLSQEFNSNLISSNPVIDMRRWILKSKDNSYLPFIIIDKKIAMVFVFSSNGELLGKTSALLGLAIGDDTAIGIGEKPLSNIKPSERTTPAGRFVASIDKSISGEEILWVHYDSGVALHRVATANVKEKRLQRLASSLIEDKRISYGCINVPTSFYEKIITPNFRNTQSIVYILPEAHTIKEIFSSYSPI